MFDLEKSAAVSQKMHRGFFHHGKSKKPAPRIKTADNHPQDPILAGKSISSAFKRVSRIALKVSELGEKSFFLSSAIPTKTESETLPGQRMLRTENVVQLMR